MIKIPAPEVQIKGLLTGDWPEEAKGFAESVTVKPTVKKADVLKYLKENPRAAQEYLDRWKDTRPGKTGDIFGIWEERAAYKVAWLTWQGHAHDTEEFRDLAEAVAEHVCCLSGIYE